MDPVMLSALVTGVLHIMDAVEGLSRTTGRKVHPEFLESQNHLRQLAVERAKSATRRDVAGESVDTKTGETVEPVPSEFVERAHDESEQE